LPQNALVFDHNLDVTTVTSIDPNSLTGPAGYGTPNYVAANTLLSYIINFENAPTATAPAKRVVITDQLDPNLNWSTLQLTGVGFGDTNIVIPPDSQFYQATVPVTENDQSFVVDIIISFNPTTGVLSAVFQSIDPNTQLPPDVLNGFLPPEDGTGRGIGYIGFLIDPKSGLPTGTQIRNVALITFDANPAIATDEVNDDDPSEGVDPTKQALVTIDAGPPTSSVGPLPPEETSTSFAVTWSGQDDPGGSGVASYDVYVSDDGGSFTLWQSDTTATSAAFTGLYGQTYGFYSVATDNVGNVQATPTSAQATTQVLPPLTVNSIGAVSPNPRNTTVSSVSVSLSELGGFGGFTDLALTLTDNGGPNLITSAVTVIPITASAYVIDGLAGLTSAEGNYTLTVNAAAITDPYGNPGAGSLSISWLMDTTPPTSTVNPLPATTTSTSFTVSVTGSDPTGSNGSPPSGVDFYAIYDSEDDGPFTLWTTVTPSNPSATFTGQAGNTYGFYSVATDNAGNVQATPTGAQTTIQILSALSLSSIASVSPNPRNTAVSSIDVTFSEPINTSSLASGALTLTDDGGFNLIDSGVSLTLVSGDTYAIGGLSGLTTAQGRYTLTLDAADIQDQNGIAGTGSLSTSWLMDTTAPSSHVVNALGTSQTSDTFPVSIDFSDPAGPGGAPASGVASVSLYVSVNNGPFSLYQSMTLTSPESSGTVTFTFDGQDRNIYAFHSIAEDAAGNIESKSSDAIEASTSVPDLNPPVTHVLASSQYSNGVFTLNWSGTDPDQDTGVPAGSIALVNVYVEVDGGAPTLIGQLNGGTPNGNGVYSGSMTYDALSDGVSHTYSFFSVGVDDEQKAQYDPNSGPATPDVTFSNITYIAPLAVQNLVVEKSIAERSFIEYLDVDFSQGLATSSALQSLESGLAGGNPGSYVELLWYGEDLTAGSTPKGSVNLFNAGSTAKLSLTGNDLSINLGAKGITSLLTETGVSGTGSPTSTFGDGWYALGIDPTGNPANHQVFWVTFFRLLGDTNGDGVVTGPYTASGTDAYAVYHAEGESGAMLDADVNGDGAVNSKDLTETVEAEGHSVGTTPPSSFPQFQLFAGTPAAPGHAIAVTQAQVQALLPEAVAAWQAAGLDAADVRRLDSVRVGVGDLGTSILGLEAAGTITINQTAAGYDWYTGGDSARTFGLVGAGGEAVAAPGSPAAGDVDLLTVLEHELGHMIGLADNTEAGDLMDITLGLGVRRSPTATDLASIAGAPSSAAPVASAALDPSGELKSLPVRQSISGATVDAALASIAAAAVGHGDGPESAVQTGPRVASIGTVPGPGSPPKRRDANPQVARSYPYRIASSWYHRKTRGIGQSSFLDRKSGS
jgi:hypothetical protein